MIESTTDISLEMNIMEIELKENGSMSRELLQIRVNEASKCSKMKISNFQTVVCENCNKLERNYFHNLKTSMKYYVLAQCFWIGYSSFELLHLNCGANFAILQ